MKNSKLLAKVLLPTACGGTALLSCARGGMGSFSEKGSGVVLCLDVVYEIPLDVLYVTQCPDRCEQVGILQKSKWICLVSCPCSFHSEIKFAILCFMGNV